jgi:deazaflavin-dependent oxidoreductase (nitroreductase family)
MMSAVGRGQLPRPLRRRWARPLVNTISRAFTVFEIRVHRSGRRTIGSRVAQGAPVLLLFTTGRRTEKRRVTPLLFHREDSGDIVLVAANGGADWNPQWLHNLSAIPEAEVEIEGRRLRVRATVLTPEERTAIWPMATEVFPTLSGAQAGTSRPIPLVRLHPSP